MFDILLVVVKDDYNGYIDTHIYITNLDQRIPTICLC